MIKQGLAALLATGAFVYLGGTALAQQTTPIQDTPVQPNQTGKTPISSSTKQFLTKTAQDSVYELASSELALQRAQSPQVADVALHIYNDHAQFQRSLLELARQYNMSLPVDLSKQDRSRLDSLSRKQGTAFDQAYIQELAKSNASSVSEFQRQASMVKNSDVQAFITNFLPTQQQHLQLANSAANGGSTTGSSGSGMNGSNGGSSTNGGTGQ